MLNAKKIKQEQIEIWNSLADTFDRSFSAVMFPAAMEMIEEAGVGGADRVLDLACGTGIDAFLAGGKLGPTGQVIGIDIAPRMVEVANAKAQARRATNVTFQCMDAERLEFENDSFDVALNKWGLMVFPDTHKSLKEVLRVLKPGGRFAAMVFGSPRRVRFLTVPALVTARFDKSVLAGLDTGSSVFKLAEEGALEAALNAAGFTSVRARRLLVMITCENGDRYWDLVITGWGRYAIAVQRQPPEVQKTIAREVKRAVEQYRTEEGIRLPIEVVVAFGQKPHQRGRAIEAPREPLPPVDVEELRRRESAGLTELSPQEAHAALAQGVLVTLDVRSARDYQAEHLAGAVSAPRGRLERVIADQVPDPRTPLLVYCGDGLAGAFASRTLTEMGYVAVRNLGGGFGAWKRAGLPTEVGSSPGSS